MSNFTCQTCGKFIIDTDEGYRTQCEHYPVKNATRTVTHVSGDLIRHVLADGRVNEISVGEPLRARVVYP